MKNLLFVLSFIFSTNAFANSALITLNAYEICPNLRFSTYGYDIPSYQVDDCIDLLEANKFQQEPASMCLSLPYYSKGYYVSGWDVNRCFKHIANNTYSDNRIKYCKNIKFLRAQSGSGTMASDVYGCLK